MARLYRDWQAGRVVGGSFVVVHKYKFLSVVVPVKTSGTPPHGNQYDTSYIRKAKNILRVGILQHVYGGMLRQIRQSKSGTNVERPDDKTTSSAQRAHEARCAPCFKAKKTTMWRCRHRLEKWVPVFTLRAGAVEYRARERVHRRTRCRSPQLAQGTSTKTTDRDFSSTGEKHKPAMLPTVANPGGDVCARNGNGV